MAPVTTTGSLLAAPSTSSTNAVSSNVSVPWATTTPSNPSPAASSMADRSASRSSSSSDGEGSIRKPRGTTSIPSNHGASSATNASAPLIGTSPLTPVGAPDSEPMVPPRVRSKSREPEAVAITRARLPTAAAAGADAMIDRLVSHAEVLTLAGESYSTRARRELLAKDRDN
jgi:hypothetical protein